MLSELPIDWVTFYFTGYALVLILVVNHLKVENGFFRVKHIPLALLLATSSWLTLVMILLVIIPWEKILDKEIF